MPHWTECSCANSPFIIPPTICVPIGCRPRYLTMRHNELASNKGVATTSISLNISWRMSHWIAWMGDMCEEDRNGRGNNLLCVYACVCLCASEFTGSCSSQWVFGSVDNRPHEKEMSYRHIQANTPLVCCSVHLCREVHTFAELKLHFLSNKHDYKLHNHKFLISSCCWCFIQYKLAIILIHSHISV